MTESFPLKWPMGKITTQPGLRKNAPFKTKMGKARDEMLHELKLLGARHIVISSNVATYSRGGKEVMYADQSAARSEPGVAVYYQWDNDSYCIACDKWKTVTENLQALNKSINAIRGLDRWGTGDMVKAAFSGFKALPQKASDGRFWEVLGIDPTNDIKAINQAYYDRSRVVHPDVNEQNTEAFIELQEARKQALYYAQNH